MGKNLWELKSCCLKGPSVACSLSYCINRRLNEGSDVGFTFLAKNGVTSEANLVLCNRLVFDSCIMHSTFLVILDIVLSRFEDG